MIGKQNSRAAEEAARARFDASLFADSRYSPEEVAEAIIALYPEAAPHAPSFAVSMIRMNIFRKDSAYDLNASVSAADGRMIFERQQALTSAYIRAKKAKRPRAHHLAVIEEYDALTARMPQESFQWWVLWHLGNQEARDSYATEAAKRREKVERDLSNAGAAVGDEVEFWSPSMIPTVPATHYRGRIRIAKDGHGYVSCRIGGGKTKQLDLYRNPWQKVTA